LIPLLVEHNLGVERIKRGFNAEDAESAEKRKE